MAVFPVRTHWAVIESVVIGFYQAHLAHDDPDLQYRFLVKPEAHFYLPVWNSWHSYVDIGHDPIFKAMLVTNLQLVTGPDIAAEYVWTPWLPPQRHIVFQGGPLSGQTEIIDAAYPTLTREIDGVRYVYNQASPTGTKATQDDPWIFTATQTAGPHTLSEHR